MTTFDPPGVHWQPVSGKLALVRLTGLLISFSVISAILAVVIWATGATQLWWLVAVLGVLWAVWCVAVFFQVRRIAYAERDEDLLIRRGYVVRSLVVVPYGRMQYVDVESGPLMQLFGLATVQLHTASVVTNAAIPGLLPDQATYLRDQLTNRGRAQLAGL